jgi:hypothetical protein
MRTMIELPDGLYRKVKAIAALRGVQAKDLIERTARHRMEEPVKEVPYRVKFPLIPWKGKRKLDLSDFDFDDLLG